MAKDKAEKALDLLIKNKKEGRISIENPEELMQKLTARYGDKAYDLVVNALVKPKNVMKDAGMGDVPPSSTKTLMYLVGDEISKENIEKLGGQVAYGEDFEGSRKQAKEDNTNAHTVIEKTTKEVADYNKEWEAYIQSQIEPHLTPQQREETITVTKEDNANANAAIEKTQEEIATYKNWQEIMDAIPTFKPQMLNKEQEEVTIPLRPKEENTDTFTKKDTRAYVETVSQSWESAKGEHPQAAPLSSDSVATASEVETPKPTVAKAPEVGSHGPVYMTEPAPEQVTKAPAEVGSRGPVYTTEPAPEQKTTTAKVTEFQGKDVALTDNSITITDKQGNGYGATVENNQLKYFNIENGARKPMDDIYMDTIGNLKALHIIAINQNPESEIGKACLEAGSPAKTAIRDVDVTLNNQQTTTHTLVVGYNHYSEQDKAALAKPLDLDKVVGTINLDAQYENSNKAIDKKADNAFKNIDEKAKASFDNIDKRAKDSFDNIDKRAQDSFNSMDNRVADAFKSMDTRTANSFDSMDKAFGKSSFDNDPDFANFGETGSGVKSQKTTTGGYTPEYDAAIKGKNNKESDVTKQSTQSDVSNTIPPAVAKTVKIESMGLDSNSAETYQIKGKTTIISENGAVVMDKNGNGHGAVLKGDKIEYFSIENGKKKPFENKGDALANIQSIYDDSIGKNPNSPFAKKCAEAGHPKAVYESKAIVNGRIIYGQPTIARRPYDAGETEDLQAKFKEKITEKPAEKGKDDFPKLAAQSKLLGGNSL